MKVRGITVDEYQAALSLIPELSESDVSTALAKTKKQLNQTELEELRASLNEALRDYVVGHLLELVLKGARPSARAKRLKCIAGSAKRLLVTIGERNDPVADAAWTEILQASRKHHEQLARLFDPMDWRASFMGARRRVAHFLDLREDIALERIKGVVVLLRDISLAASARERKLIENKATKKARYEGDDAMQELFCALNDIWQNSFHQLSPGVTFDSFKKVYGGRYKNFVSYVLYTYAAKVPDELERLATGLRASLKLTDNAIHSRFRNTKVSQLRREVNSVQD